MLLGVKDRILLIQLLPEEDNVVTLRVISELQGKLGFTETEVSGFGIRDVDGKVTWDHSEDVDIEIGPKATETVRKILIKRNEQCKLTKNHLNLCALFEVE
jgi:hypothetical protein